MVLVFNFFTVYSPRQFFAQSTVTFFTPTVKQTFSLIITFQEIKYLQLGPNISKRKLIFMIYSNDY